MVRLISETLQAEIARSVAVVGMLGVSELPERIPLVICHDGADQFHDSREPSTRPPGQLLTEPSAVDDMISDLQKWDRRSAFWLVHPWLEHVEFLWIHV